MQCVIGEEEEEEPVTEDQVLSQAESLNDRRILLAGFLKLIMYCVFDTTVAAPVFANYVKVSKSIHSTLGYCSILSRNFTAMVTSSRWLSHGPGSPTLCLGIALSCSAYSSCTTHY